MSKTRKARTLTIEIMDTTESARRMAEVWDAVERQWRILPPTSFDQRYCVVWTAPQARNDAEMEVSLDSDAARVFYADTHQNALRLVRHHIAEAMLQELTRAHLINNGLR